MAWGWRPRRRASRSSSTRRAPRSSRSTPADGATVTTARPTISVQFSEPVVVASWSHLGLVVQSAPARSSREPTAYYPSIRTGTFIPSVDLAPGYVYIVTVGDVRDLAGNRVTGAGSWTHQASLSSSVTRSRDAERGGLRLIGPARPGPRRSRQGESLALEAREGAATEFSSVRSVVPSAGRYGITLTPATQHLVQSRLRGLRDDAGRVGVGQVIVRRKVSLLGSGSATTRTAVAGRPVMLTAQWARRESPRSPSSSTGTTPRGAGTSSAELRPDDRPLGRARLTWTPSAGRFAWRVAVGIDRGLREQPEPDSTAGPSAAEPGRAAGRVSGPPCRQPGSRRRSPTLSRTVS